ncbi:hypothetical protein N7520_011212 [Penicillium odoratum]|uniref:uncharacterized protein n=1 Tax=Penicillium odoratum TaxID=1167516 RepID=UPI002547CFBD|nr:uncharacterized protein N7520_011212 [Penicillium odoratum]KAJ5746030.1 hypothetical protein N7520_011212 [Penicillium odoratum]
MEPLSSSQFLRGCSAHHRFNYGEFYTIVDDDSFASIESLYGVTFAELYEWNPAIGSDCKSLWMYMSFNVGH